MNCARKNCNNEIPPEKLTKGAKFCSSDCRKRDCKQRWQKKTYKSPQVRKPGHTEFVGEG